VHCFCRSTSYAESDTHRTFGWIPAGVANRKVISSLTRSPGVLRPSAVHSSAHPGRLVGGSRRYNWLQLEHSGRNGQFKRGAQMEHGSRPPEKLSALGYVSGDGNAPHFRASRRRARTPRQDRGREPAASAELLRKIRASDAVPAEEAIAKEADIPTLIENWAQLFRSFVICEGCPVLRKA